MIDDMKNLDKFVTPDKQKDHEIEVARTFEEGMKALKGKEWDLLLLDHDLGQGDKKDGTVIMNWLRDQVIKDPKRIPKKIEIISSNSAATQWMPGLAKNLTNPEWRKKQKERSEEGEDFPDYRNSSLIEKIAQRYKYAIKAEQLFQMIPFDLRGHPKVKKEIDWVLHQFGKKSDGAIWYIRIFKKGLEDPDDSEWKNLEKNKEKIKHMGDMLRLNHTKNMLKGYVFKKDLSVDKALEDIRAAEADAHARKEEKDLKDERKRVLEKDENGNIIVLRRKGDEDKGDREVERYSIKEGKVFLKLDGDWAWWDLKTRESKAEARAMRSCGRCGSGSTLLSLREYKETYDGHDFYKSHLTFEYSPKKHQLIQRKGYYNSKPEEKYHDHIVKLLKHKNIKYMDSSSDWSSESDFQMDELKDDHKKELSHKKTLHHVDKFHHMSEEDPEKLKEYALNEEIVVSIRQKAIELLKDQDVAKKILKNHSESSYVLESALKVLDPSKNQALLKKMMNDKDTDKWFRSKVVEKLKPSKNQDMLHKVVLNEESTVQEKIEAAKKLNPLKYYKTIENMMSGKLSDSEKSKIIPLLDPIKSKKLIEDIARESSNYSDIKKVTMRELDPIASKKFLEDNLLDKDSSSEVKKIILERLDPVKSYSLFVKIINDDISMYSEDRKEAGKRFWKHTDDIDILEKITKSLYSYRDRDLRDEVEEKINKIKKRMESDVPPPIPKDARLREKIIRRLRNA